MQRSILKVYGCGTITIALLLCLLQVYGQTDTSLQVLKKQFNGYQQKNLPEKLFVHTDKSFYLAGETLWFKIYSVDGTYNKPLAISQVAYLEILDRNNNPVTQVKISLKNGSGSGSVYLNSSLSSGNYVVRAYTSWMKNYSANLYFHKTISLVNTTATTVQEPVKQQANYSVQFYPEGGNLVEGIESKIGFQVLNEQGKGIDCRGVIYKGKDTLTNFKTLKSGIGSFQFKPMPGETYLTRVYLPNNRTITKALPVAYQNGCVMQVSNQGNTQVLINVAVESKENAPVYLIAFNGQEAGFAETGMLKNGMAQFVVDRNKLPKGVTTFTVFNKSRQAVCERLYFNKSNNSAQTVVITPDKQKYGSRQKTLIDINLPGLLNEKADLSVAVYRLDSLEQPEEVNIADYLYLTSQLKGKVESPGYYLNTTGN
ncbi:MAG TPA: hypothetical protein VF623_05790, partial [Segetibacter sp.]